MCGLTLKWGCRLSVEKIKYLGEEKSLKIKGEYRVLNIRYWVKNEFGKETETANTYTNSKVNEGEDIGIQISTFIQHLENCGYDGDHIKDELRAAMKNMSIDDSGVGSSGSDENGLKTVLQNMKLHQ